MSPAEHVRVILTEFKELGTPFHLAWANAMRTLPRNESDYAEWKEAFKWSRPAWKACYEDEGWKAVHKSSDDTAPTKLVQMVPRKPLLAVAA